MSSSRHGLDGRGSCLVESRESWFWECLVEMPRLHGDMRHSVEAVLSEDRVRDGGIFSYEEVERLLGEHLSSRADHAYKLWALYVFQKWQEDRSS